LRQAFRTPYLTAQRNSAPGGRRRELAIPAALSPDFNPIEMALAKLKALSRFAAARTISDLYQPLPTPNAASPHKNAPIISPPQDPMQYDRKLL
jgi:hypothetical protein